MAYWRDVNGSTVMKFDGGSQVEHVLSHLHAAAKRKGFTNMDFTKYQFVYQPAMSMWEKNRLSVRNEEGLLILSKYPIIDTKVLFLPRMLGDAGDDHQRLALVAQIELPVKSTGEKALISISTSHFRYDRDCNCFLHCITNWKVHDGNSLKESSRDLSVEAITDFFDTDSSMKKSGVQVSKPDTVSKQHIE